MPEQLDTRSISWKVYASPDSTNVDGDNTLLFFRQYHERAELGARALQPSFPGDVEADAAAADRRRVRDRIATAARRGDHGTDRPGLSRIDGRRVTIQSRRLVCSDVFDHTSLL